MRRILTLSSDSSSIRLRPCQRNPWCICPRVRGIPYLGCGTFRKSPTFSRRTRIVGLLSPERITGSPCQPEASVVCYRFPLQRQATTTLDSPMHPVQAQKHNRPAYSELHPWMHNQAYATLTIPLSQKWRIPQSHTPLQYRSPHGVPHAPTRPPSNNSHFLTTTQIPCPAQIPRNQHPL